MTRPDATELRDMAVDSLRRAIELCREMMDNKDLAVSVKLKWVNSLAQVSGVLLKALRDAGVTFAEEDEITIAELIAQLPKAADPDLHGVPKKFWRHRVNEVKKVLDRYASRWGSLKDAAGGDVHSQGVVG